MPIEDDSDDDVQVSVEKNTANGLSQKSTPSKNSGKATAKTMQSPPGFTYGEANKNGSPGRQNYVTRNSEFKVIYSFVHPFKHNLSVGNIIF